MCIRDRDGPVGQSYLFFIHTLFAKTKAIFINYIILPNIARQNKHRMDRQKQEDIKGEKKNGKTIFGNYRCV